MRPWTSPGGGSETILLAEDDPQVRDFLDTVLGGAGYSVINAQDGLDAIEQFRKNKESIDLIILDVGMPHITGSAASEIILSERPSSKILFLSGYTDDNIEINKIAIRGYQLIKKPIPPRVLLEKIREIIEGQ